MTKEQKLELYQYCARIQERIKKVEAIIADGNGDVVIKITPVKRTANEELVYLRAKEGTFYSMLNIIGLDDEFELWKGEGFV